MATRNIDWLLLGGPKDGIKVSIAEDEDSVFFQDALSAGLIPDMEISPTHSISGYRYHAYTVRVDDAKYKIGALDESDLRKRTAVEIKRLIRELGVQPYTRSRQA